MLPLGQKAEVEMVPSTIAEENQWSDQLVYSSLSIIIINGQADIEEEQTVKENHLLGAGGTD